MSVKLIKSAYDQAEKIAAHTPANLKELSDKIWAYSQQIELGSKAWTAEEQVEHTNNANVIRAELIEIGISAESLDLVKHSAVYA